MNGQALLDAMAMCGIKASLDGDRLIVNAPRGSLTADDREVLAAHKAELIELLTPKYPPPAPMPWREVLAKAPIALRERWGIRTNELEATGLEWREAEERAFQELAYLIAPNRQAAA